MTKVNRDKLVDFIVTKISDESDDYSKYNEWAGNEAVSELNGKMADLGAKMKQIADDERKHRECLIKMLADIAKGDIKNE